MNALQRTGPLREAQLGHAKHWAELESMPVAAAFADPETDARRLVLVGVGDTSHKRHAGAKGPGAQAWLGGLGITTPTQPNTWLRLDCGSLVARLGLSEYVVAGSPHGETVERVATTPPVAGVYPVPRFDAEIVLAGRHVHDLMKQACSFDFEGLDLSTRPLVMTSMVGVTVSVIASQSPSGPVYALWCDGTYGPYLWTTLVEIATSFGGGAVGLEALGPLAR